MKNILVQTVVLFAAILLLQSCYDNPTFIEENAQKGDKYPVLADVSGFDDQYSPGDVVTFKLQYFSEVEIDVINLYEQIIISDDTTQNQVFSKPYEPAFSERLRLDTMVVDYEVPDVPNSTEITLTSEIVNTNTLTDSQSFTFTVQNE